MTLDWDTLRIFLAAHRAGSLRAASADLQNGHATVRRAIERLENTLETRVFERSGTGLRLTSAGELLLNHAEQIERQTLDLERQLYGQDNVPRGRITVSIPPSFAGAFFAPILADFAQNYPEIDVDVVATNEISDLERHEADISVRAAHSVEDDVVGRRLVDYTAAAFAAPSYLARVGTPQAGDGANAEWLGWGDDGSWIKTTPFPKARQRHALFEVFMQIEAAANGLGMIWIPTFLGDADDRIMRVPDAPAQPDRSLWLLLHSDLRDTARVRAFVDHFADYIANHRSQFSQ